MKHMDLEPTLLVMLVGFDPFFCPKTKPVALFLLVPFCVFLQAIYTCTDPPPQCVHRLQVTVLWLMRSDLTSSNGARNALQQTKW